MKISLLLFTSDAKAVTASLQAFDITVILVCFISCTLCVRSVFKSVKLAKVCIFCIVLENSFFCTFSFGEHVLFFVSWKQLKEVLHSFGVLLVVVVIRFAPVYTVSLNPSSFFEKYVFYRKTIILPEPQFS